MKTISTLLVLLLAGPAFAQTYPVSGALVRVASPSAVSGVSCATGANLVVNCGFESGDLSGWINNDIANPFSPTAAYLGGLAPQGLGLFATAPTERNYVALAGFDGGGPGRVELAQQLWLGEDTTELTFDYRIGWDLMNYCNGCTGSRTFQIEVQPPLGGAALQTTVLVTAAPTTITLDGGPQSATIDLTAFAGQEVRLAFVSVVPENFTGPGYVQIDNVRVDGTAPLIPIPATSPLSLAVLALMLVGVGVLTRVRRTS